MNNELEIGVNYQSVILKDFTVPMVEPDDTFSKEPKYIVDGDIHEVDTIYEEIEKDYAYMAEDLSLEDMKLKGLFYKFEDMDRERLHSIYEKIIQSFLYNLTYTITYYIRDITIPPVMITSNISREVTKYVVDDYSLVDKILDIAYILDRKLPGTEGVSNVDLQYSIMTLVDQNISTLHSIVHSTMFSNLTNMIDPITFANITEVCIIPFKILHDNLLYYILTMSNEIYINRYGVFNHGEKNNV